MANPTPETEKHYNGMNPDERSQAWVLFHAMSLFAGKMDAIAWSFHPHIRIRDLSDERQQMIGQHVRRMLAERESRGSSATEGQVYLAALEHFGVDCPHAPLTESRYYEDPRCVLECRNCGTIEFVNDPNDNPRMQMIARSLRYIGESPPKVDWTGTDLPDPKGT